MCQSLAIAPNGQILLSGTSTFLNAPDLPAAQAGAFGLARLNTDGGLDSTFGDRGIVTSDLFAFGPTFILIQPDERILVVGSAIGNTPIGSTQGITTLALARFLGQ